MVLPCLVILVCTALIRIRGAWNDLTLDEIMSLNGVAGLSSAFDIFTKLHIDNNHYLNSLWLYFAGPRGDWDGYRIPSILAGIGTVAVAWLIGRRRSPANAWIAMFLTGFSYVLVLYSDQARGYSSMVFFSFFSYYILDNFLKSGSLKIAALFWLCAILGFLSHIDFITFLGATVPWAAWRLFRSRVDATRAVGGLLLCYAVPAIVVAGLYLVDIRQMTVLGGSETTLFNAWSTSLAWVLPPVAPGAGTAAMCLIVAAGLAAGCRMLWREKSDSLIFFIGVIVVFPLLLVIVNGAKVLYVRYFILGISFSLVLLSMVLASIYSRGFKGRVLCLALLLAYFIANGRCILILFKDGQGNYTGAIQTMERLSGEQPATIGAAQDFRVQRILQFYNSQLPPGRKISFLLGGTWPKGGPEWVIFEKESYEKPVPPGKSLGDGAGNTYLYFQTIPAAPLSAQHWFLYRNKAKEPVTAS